MAIESRNTHRSTRTSQRGLPWRHIGAAWLIGIGLIGCGGGGGGGSEKPAAAVAVPGGATIAAASTVQNFCVAPRAGIDPSTGSAYADKPGTLDQEKSWVRSFLNDTYLWYDEIPATVLPADFATPVAYFDKLKTPALTPSGKPKDRFHFSYPTDVWLALSQSGQAAGYGMEIALLRTTPPREVRIAFTDPGTPAAAAGITRGARITAIDGADVLNGNAVDTLNAGLFPKSANETHVFTIQDVAGMSRSVTLTSALVTSTPVQNVQVVTVGARKIGYLLFNDHIATAEGQLVAAVNQLKQLGANELVIDVRYNGGGFLAIASQLAYMVAPASATAGKTFEQLIFNSKNPFNATAAQTLTPFYATTLDFSVPSGQALPQLGFSRVALLTGPGSCSATESIANGLRGVDVQVDLIGETTCGKPYGFFPTANCGTTYFAIQFKGVNHKGQGDYADGLAPTCQVADDFSRALGDPLEARFATAIAYRGGSPCPPPTSTVTAAPPGSVAQKSSRGSAGPGVEAEIGPNPRQMKILQPDWR